MNKLQTSQDIMNLLNARISYISLQKEKESVAQCKTHELKSKTDNVSSLVSSIGTYNYTLAKFLGELLNPITPLQHWFTDSFSFCKEMQEVSVFNKFMISYDVCNLFTNIPLKETIKLAWTYIRKTSGNKSHKETAY